MKKETIKRMRQGHRLLYEATSIKWLLFAIVLLIAICYCSWMSVHYHLRHYTSDDITSRPLDYLGLIAGFFALLVTLLVGWQIYSTIKAKEELKDFTDQFDERLTHLEECCTEGNTRMTKIENDAKDLEERLKGIIWSEVYFAITGYDAMNHKSSEDWIKNAFSAYTNISSQSLKTMARQVLLAEFSKKATIKNQESFINEVIGKVPKSKVEALQKELSENRDWIQYTESDKINELIETILKSYPKESK